MNAHHFVVILHNEQRATREKKAGRQAATKQMQQQKCDMSYNSSHINYNIQRIRRKTPQRRSKKSGISSTFCVFVEPWNGFWLFLKLDLKMICVCAFHYIAIWSLLTFIRTLDMLFFYSLSLALSLSGSRYRSSTFYSYGKFPGESTKLSKWLFKSH